jgi:hypothetical protein
MSAAIERIEKTDSGILSAEVLFRKLLSPTSRRIASHEGHTGGKWRRLDSSSVKETPNAQEHSPARD